MQRNADQDNKFSFSLLSLFWKNKSMLKISPCCLCIPPPPKTFECLNQSLWNLVHIMAPEPISKAYFINPCHQSVCLHVYCPLLLLGNNSVNTFPWQWIHATIEELLDASFSIWSMSCQRSVCGSVYPSIVAWQWLSKHVPTGTKNCWRRRFLYGPCCVKEVSVGLCIPLSLLGNGSVNTFPREQRIVGGVVFYMVHVVSKKCLWVCVSLYRCLAMAQ
jgi:Zn-finger protein